MSNKGRPKLVLSENERKERLASQKQSYTNANRNTINVKRRVGHISEQQRSNNLERNNAAVAKRKETRQHQILGCLQGVENVPYFDFGDMTEECAFCKGLTFKNETGRSKHSCCHNGKISLEYLEPYPTEIITLLFGNSEESRHFRQNIRVYNNLFAFASFNCTSNDVGGKGPYCMRVVGEAHLKATTSLISQSRPRYGQVYIYDDNETVKYRLNSITRPSVLSFLHQVLKSNPYAISYKHLFEVYNSTNETSLSLNFLTYSQDDRRRYNIPIVNSIAAIILSKDGDIPDNVDIKVFPKNSVESSYIHNTSQHCDPMQFPLLFPRGEHGWSHLMKTRYQKNISPLQYYSYRLCERAGILNPLLCAGRLTQQYIINAYLTVESQRLKFIRYNQSNLRIECYRGLLDHVQNKAANNVANVKTGNVYILPSTFSGSPRSMQQLYHDAMAICRKLGRPDLFITMTCNPNWPEVKRYLNNMPQGTSAIDIPHFTCRIFYQKANNLIKDLDCIFGGIRAYVYTIEFQKRGLPHMHLLVTLQNKLYTSDDIDKFISAEIPNKSTHPLLWQKVMMHMLHGPHGKSTPCFDSAINTCAKGFPKPFGDATEMNTAGFPNYRRSDNRNELHTYLSRKATSTIHVDNSMVVPYNPYMIMKYDCHINVEYCASVMGIKYIHKYIHKGHDRARIAVSANEVFDEISEYVDARYLSATESAWRIFELPMHGRSHAVERLPVHLPDMNCVVYREGNEESAVRNVRSKLTAYFELNQNDEFAKQLKYEEIPNYYSWIHSKYIWQRRVRNVAIVSRIITVSTKEVELFHLKLLIRKISGAKCFNDLKTKDGIVFTTFKEAACAFGYASTENEISEIMSEAASCLMPKELRKFFVYILIGCSDVDGLCLWNNFKNQLSDGISEHEALFEINVMLEEENFDNARFGLPNVGNNISNTNSIDIHTATQHKNLYQHMYQSLNNMQKHIFDIILTSIDNNCENKCFYVDGPAGCGKTFLYETIIHCVASKNIKLLTLAWTGIAAILLPFGKTAHKSFQLPLNVNEPSTLFWNSKTKELLKSTDVFIWDEASMIPANALESIDIALRDTCSSSKPFGGKLFLLGGDFRQILPVVKKAGKTQVIQSTIKYSYLWSFFQCFRLFQNMRITHDAKFFSDWLLSIGNGTVEELEIPESMLSSDLVTSMYCCDEDNVLLHDQAILTPKNEDVSMINKRILMNLPGNLITVEGIDHVRQKGTDGTDESAEFTYPLDYVNSLTPSGFPPQKLLLKIGAVVMLIRNLSVSDGLCNGTRLLVKRASKFILCCQILAGDKKGNIVYIPRITLDSTTDNDMPFVLYRTQFPVRLSFAMTINKSQGQSFKKIGLYLQDENSIFSHGQLYVAFSRCRSYNNIKVQIASKSSNKKVKNMVFKEILC